MICVEGVSARRLEVVATVLLSLKLYFRLSFDRERV
jgi:hypothetical protein